MDLEGKTLNQIPMIDPPFAATFGPAQQSHHVLDGRLAGDQNPRLVRRQDHRKSNATGRRLWDLSGTMRGRDHRPE